MCIKELTLRNRSYRRFDSTRKISESELVELVDMGRLCPSARNLQSIKYLLSFTDDMNEKIFSTLSWAGYLAEWSGPELHERPTGYILILNDLLISDKLIWDHGIVAQTILLGATEMGLGGCIIGSINKKSLREYIKIPNYLDIELILALGKPAEKVVLDEIDNYGDVKYWRDNNGIHHVPKRRLKDIIVRAEL